MYSRIPVRLILALQAARGSASKPGLPCVGLSFLAAVLGFRSRWSLKLAAAVQVIVRYSSDAAATFRSRGAVGWCSWLLSVLKYATLVETSRSHSTFDLMKQ